MPSDERKVRPELIIHVWDTEKSGQTTLCGVRNPVACIPVQYFRQSYLEQPEICNDCKQVYTTYFYGA